MNRLPKDINDPELGFNVNYMWAILDSPAGTLACWRNSQGVPFMSPNKRLVRNSIKDQEGYLTPLPPGGERQVIPVVMMSSKTQQKSLVLNPETGDLYCLLKPTNSG